MKILIGTPIHIAKDYSMKRWLENVSKLLLEYQADFMMVDNSPGLEYVEKVKGYLAKYGIKNYKIEHLALPPEQGVFERVARSREIIRQEILAHGYNAWFSWECDQLIPTHALNELVRMMKAGDFMIVAHNSWSHEVSPQPNFDFGVALISREALEKYSFILDFGTDPDMPDTWEPGEAWLRHRVLRDGGSYIEVDGVIDPIDHLVE